METLIVLAITVLLGIALQKIWKKIIPKQTNEDGLRFKVKIKAVIFILVSIVVVFIFGYFIWTF